MSFDDITRNTNEKSPARAASGRGGPSLALIALLVLAGLALIFILQNQNEVRTHFLFFTKTSKVWASIGVAIVLGAALDRLASMWWRHRKQKDL